MNKATAIKKLAELDDILYAGFQLAAELRKGLLPEGRGTTLPSTRKGLKMSHEKLRNKRIKTLTRERW